MSLPNRAVSFFNTLRPEQYTHRTFSIVYNWIKIISFTKYHWSLCLRIQLTMCDDLAQSRRQALIWTKDDQARYPLKASAVLCHNNLKVCVLGEGVGVGWGGGFGGVGGKHYIYIYIYMYLSVLYPEMTYYMYLRNDNDPFIPNTVNTMKPSRYVMNIA